MATAGDRLQIVLTAKDEISAQLRQTKSEMTQLGRTAASLQSRMESGEQGLQNELEQTRLELEKNRQKQLELGRAASKVKTEIRQMTTEGTAGAKRMDRSMDGLNRSMGKTHSASKTMAVGWGKVAGAAAAVTAAIGATAGAFRFLTDSISEARDARKAMAQTAAVMRSMGRTEAPKAITKMINRLEELSGIDGDALREMTNVMFTFGNVTGDTFMKANELALDLSVAFGKDLQSSAVMVGKALNDPLKGLTALSRIGVQFTAKQEKQIKAMMAVNDVAGAQKIIMRELTKQVGGSAKAQADGIAKTQVAWGNLKEAIGEVLLSTGTGGLGVVQMLKDATKWIKKHQGEIIAVLQTVMAVTFQVISVWLKWESIVVKFFGYLLGAMATTLDVLADLGLVSRETADKVKGLADGFGEFSEKLDKGSKWAKKQADALYGTAHASQRLKEKLAGVGIEVDKLNAKKVKNLLRNNPIPGVNSQGGTVPGAAMGGPVFGETLVGELGPELFVPNFGTPAMIGVGGPEVRDFSTPGYVIPNHLLTSVTNTTVRERVVVERSERGPLVENLVVRSEADAMRELERMRAREVRIARERGA